MERQIGHTPDQKSRRNCHGCGPAKYEQSTIEDRSDQNRSDLRLPVGRKFQRKGRRNPFEHGNREKPGDSERRADTKKNHKRQEQGRQKRSGQPFLHTGEKDRNQCDQRGKSSVTGNKAVGQDGQKPFSWGIDDPASGHSGSIAAKAHSHAEGLFSAGMAALERPVQIVGQPRQIACVF